MNILRCEAEEVIKNIVGKYHSNFYCFADIMVNRDVNENLYEFYQQNNRPLSWKDDERPKKIRWYIRFYGCEESSLQEELIVPILDDIKWWDVPVEDVTFSLYEKETDKTDKVTYKYTLDGTSYIQRD